MKITSTPADCTPLGDTVTELAGELTNLRGRAADLQQRRVELRATGTTGSIADNARRADLAARTQAAREGSDVAAVGTPNTDALNTEREQITATLDAIDAAITDVSADLCDAIRDGECAAITADIVNQAAAAYIEAVDTVGTARAAFLDAVALATWTDQAAASGPHSTDFGSSPRHPESRIGSGLDTFTWPTVAGLLTAEAGAAGRPTPRRQTSIGTL